MSIDIIPHNFRVHKKANIFSKITLQITAGVPYYKQAEKLPEVSAEDFEDFKQKYGIAVEFHIKSDRMKSDPGKYKKTLKERFSHGSDEAQKLFTRYVPQDVVEDASFMGTARYHPGTKKISMHYGADAANNRGAGAAASDMRK